MNEENLQQLKAFGYSTTENKKHYTFDEALMAMAKFAGKAVEYFDRSCSIEDDLISQGLMDGSIKQFENFTESFKDIITMYMIECGNQVPQYLSDCIRFIRKTSELNSYEMGITELMYSRNKIVHEYYNMEFMTEEFKTAMTNYADGLKDLCKTINTLVDSKNLREHRIYKK